jgi:hypothetical protein
MSAAATAAGYLYASGRLRGRNREDEAQELEQRTKPRRKEVKVAVYPPAPQAPAKPAEPRAKPAPKIQYRTRRWKPE